METNGLIKTYDMDKEYNIEESAKLADKLKNLGTEDKKSEPKTKEKEEPKKSSVKGTDAFVEAIKTHLRAYATKDPLFGKTLHKPNKNLNDCITFIFNHVKKSGMVGYAEEEIFKIARHYYDEHDIEVGEPITQGEVISNQRTQLSQEEIDKAKQEGRERVIQDEMNRMRKKPAKKPTPIVQLPKTTEEVTEDEPEATSDTQGSLF
jgi:hypothetical protein